MIEPAVTGCETRGGVLHRIGENLSERRDVLLTSFRRPGHAGRELWPVLLRLVEILRSFLRLVIEGSRAPIRDPRCGRAKTGWFWAGRGQLLARIAQRREPRPRRSKSNPTRAQKREGAHP